MVDYRKLNSFTVPDQTKPFEVEVDTSNYAIGTILMQRDDKNILHPVAYFSKTMNDVQRNYDVYNRELLGLQEMFKHWRAYLHGAMHQVKVHTDHANLLFWKNPGDHNRRVARWHSDLMDYDFQLVHIPGKKNGRVDALSRCPDYDQGEDDNKQLVVLPPKFFSQVLACIVGSEEANPNNKEEWARYRDGVDPGNFQSMQEAVERDQQENKESQERLRRWTNTHQLIKRNLIWWKDNRIVIAGDNDLKRGVIHSFHDKPSTGHPGISNTYRLARHDTWWPNMKQDIKQYVKGCATCQANKVNTGPLKPAMIPITPEHTLPFETVAMDFITKLPQSGKYNMILTITDHDCSKAAIFIPCQEAISAEEVAGLLLKYLYPQFGVPKKIISDRDTKFTSKYAKGLCQALKIRQNISTAYHPRTDGQSERTNQWLEQYLRCFCEDQNNWHQWLPFAEFAHNQWPHETTKKTPFDLIMGFTPKTDWLGISNVPTVTNRLEEMEQARNRALAEMGRAQKIMAMRNQGNKRFKPYNKGDQVWVEGMNIKTLYPLAKLSPKRYGPFKVLEQLLEAVYRLEIPRHWKIHNVFHANLITPYKEMELHRPNFTHPPPDLIEGEQEFEVKKILDVQPRGQGRKMHFLVKWKGYPTSDNSWEPRENLHADRLITEYNKKKQEQTQPKKKGVKSQRARTDKIIPTWHHYSHLHTNPMSAHSAPIVSSSTPSTPVSMSSSTPREATSSSATPTTTPTSPVLRGSSKANLPSYRQFGLIHCGQCRLPKEYSHTMWARGIVSGWTCHCNRTPSSPTNADLLHNAVVEAVNPLNSPELPISQTVKDAQSVHDAGCLLAREEQTGKYAPWAEPSATGHDNDEEEGKDMTEEDPLEWAYSMKRVPKIEVLVTQEVKRTVEANRQDDTQSGVLEPMKKARESWVVRAERQEGWPQLMTAARTLLQMTLEERVGLMKIREDTQKVCGACWRHNPGHIREECPKYEMCWACGNMGAQGFISCHHCKPAKVQAVPWGPATETYKEADLSWYQGHD